MAKAKARPKIPLPMMALLRLNEDIPKEVIPGCLGKKKKEAQYKKMFAKGSIFALVTLFTVSPEILSPGARVK